MSMASIAPIFCSALQNMLDMPSGGMQQTGALALNAAGAPALPHMYCSDRTAGGCRWLLVACVLLARVHDDVMNVRAWLSLSSTRY
jgi:hypothetical protein